MTEQGLTNVAAEKSGRRNAFNFLSQGGELGALTREKDWSCTPLGPPSGWPETLKTTLRLVLTSNHPMFVWWGADLIQFYNDAYRKTMGPERHPNALGQPGRECWGEIWDIIGPQIESIMAGGPATWHEDQLVPVTRHGRREDVWWTYGYSPIEDSTGVRGVLVVCNDVTSEHQAKADLRQANELLKLEIRHREQEATRIRSFFTQAPGFMAILRGPEHTFEFINSAYLRLVGERDLLGRTARDALPEVAGQGFFELLDQVYSSGKPYSAYDQPLTVVRPDTAGATQTYVDFVYQPIVEANGVVSGIFVEGIDATERHEAKEALEESQVRLKEGLAAARMAIWNYDLRTGAIISSENVPSLFGRMWSSVPDAWKHMHADDLRQLNIARKAALATCGDYDAVVRFTRPDNGSVLWIQVYGKVACDDQKVPRSIRGVFLDITARKEAEIALSEANRRKDEFLAMLAHELRNPLAPISTAAMLLKVGMSDPKRIAQTSEIISRQVSHMTGLINDLLDVSRVTTGIVTLDQQLLDVRQVLYESVEQVTPAMEAKGHSFTYHVPAEAGYVLGDRKRLVQVVTNLLQNAAKYTPANGNISLSTQQNETEVSISVSDNGTGIDSDLLPHVFDLFTQAKRTSDRAQGGLGLGLALVKSLVALHGGRVEATSEGSGQGSTFTVRLPAFNTVSSDGDFDVQGNEKAGPHNRLRVLVVDDNTDAADAIAMFFEAAGHKVVVEYGPMAALNQVKHETYDVFVLDIGLPGIDGNELARRLRSIPAAARATLIALTGYGQEYDKETSISAGFDYYFVKPANPVKLVELLAGIKPTL